MKEVYVVGTIHLNWTPKEELEEVLEELRPDKLFIELTSKELYEESREESIRDEMFVAYDWAVSQGVPFAVFDTEDSPLKEGVTGKEPEFTEHELKSKELLKDYSWKDLNQKDPWNIAEVAKLEKEIEDKYFDKERSKQREFTMLENIKKELVEGRIVIVTGAGHLTFFKEHIPEAQLPLRDS